MPSKQKKRSNDEISKKKFASCDLFNILSIFWLAQRKEKVLQQKVEEKQKIDIAEMKKRTENVKTLINLFGRRLFDVNENPKI